MKLWLNAQLPPLLAGSIKAQEKVIQAFAVRDVGLRDASDAAIFRAALEAGVEVMIKDGTSSACWMNRVHGGRQPGGAAPGHPGCRALSL